MREKDAAVEKPDSAVTSHRNAPEKLDAAARVRR